MAEIVAAALPSHAHIQNFSYETPGSTRCGKV